MSEMDTSFKHLPTSMHRPCNSYVSPIFFHSKERTYNGFGTDLKRRLNEGRTKAERRM